MKKITAFMMALLLIASGIVCMQFPNEVKAEESQGAASVWDGTADDSWYTSDTSKTTYTITTAAQLAGLAKIVNAQTTTFEGVTIELGADIVLNEGNCEDWGTTAPDNKWTPIGLKKPNDVKNFFKGIFDGCGHTISGMYIDDSDGTMSTGSVGALGLFGVCAQTNVNKEMAIKNVSLVNSYVSCAVSDTAAMLVGQIYTSVAAEINLTDLYVQGVLLNTGTIKSYSGGVCAYINLQNTTSDPAIRFSNVVSDVDITAITGTTEKTLGGILAIDAVVTNRGYKPTGLTFENCVNIGNLISTTNSIGGGMLGRASGIASNTVSMQKCVNAGTVNCKLAGAAIGYVQADGTVTITGLLNAGSVKGTSTNKGAAVTGLYKSGITCTKTINNCFSVACDNMSNATTIADLTAADTLTTLSSGGFDTTGWTMVTGIAPLPSAAAKMMGLTFEKVSLTLDSSMQMNFKVRKNDANCYSVAKASFELNGDTKEVTAVEEDGYYVFKLSGIAPYQMGDTISATLNGTYDGTSFSGTGTELSISDYCYKLLNSETVVNDKLKTLVVALLNYGTESQKMDGQTGNYVNAGLTEEQQQLVGEDVTLKTVKNKAAATTENASVTWKSAGLNLTEKVVIRLKLQTENTEGMYVKFADSLDGTGNSVKVTAFTAIEGEANCYYVYLDSLNAYQMRKTIYATVYNASDQAVSDTMSYSIESYAYDAQNRTDNNLGNLVKAMMQYGVAAESYQAE